MLTKDSSFDSGSPKSYSFDFKGKKKEETDSGAFDSLDWSKIVVITRRYFHDDWKKTMVELQEQLDLNITYRPFHAEKTVVVLEDKNLVNLFCKNKG